MEKRNKYIKNITIYIKKKNVLINHIEFIYQQNYIEHKLYIEVIHLLNNAFEKVKDLSIWDNKKKINKNNYEELFKLLDSVFEKVCYKVGSSHITDIFQVLLLDEIPMSSESKDILYIINDYFLPLSVQVISSKIESFLITNNIKIEKKDLLIHNLIHSPILFNEKIEGSSIIFMMKEKILCINGFFKKDPIGICKNMFHHQKIKNIKDELEYFDVPSFFKETYIEQISVRDLFVYSIKDIVKNIKEDYHEFQSYKNTSLSVLVKEFLKSTPEKQRKIIILFLCSDTESQFTAHILYDLIYENSYISDIYKSFDWKIQKLFQTSQTQFENKKKTIHNSSIQDIPYESKIISLQIDEKIKIRAMDKVKEVNGSKDNSIKAQQWLDGFLKIPFQVYKKESIIHFFKQFQSNFDKCMNTLTSRLNDYNIYILENHFLYDKLCSIVNEYHSITYTSENSFTTLCDFIQISINDHFNLKIESFEENNSAINQDEEDINLLFHSFAMNILKELKDFIDKWNDFKLKKIEYMNKIDIILDKCTFGQKEAKTQMKRIIGQWIHGTSKGQCIGLHGPPGVGKTVLCKNGLSKCLFDENGESRPFAFLPLGGATNGSFLEGHNYTYLGSTWGKIVDILIETKCMNPIIYIDELDKISKTEHGREIISILIHITDQSQNKEFFDKYFCGIPIDLSQILFIFSYNDRDNIDRILLDRIQEIHVKPLNTTEKLIISQNYILPEIFRNVGFSNTEIQFNNEIIEYIINKYTHEAGMRKLNEIYYDIIRQLNLNKITQLTNSKKKYIISKELIKDILRDKHVSSIKKINSKPMVGIVNGLYATTSGLGGITYIQALLTYTDKKYSLEKLTGSQGDVMKESMSCAMTLAWNILPAFRKEEISKNGNYGFHIHCPESATPKDGPSAGLAITTAIYSQLMDIPVINDVAMTGEVDLLGNACKIGGVHSKLMGALQAGVKKVLFPFENKQDIDLIFLKEEEDNKNIMSIYSTIQYPKNTVIHEKKYIYRDEMEIILVDTIYDILEICVPHSIIKE